MGARITDKAGVFYRREGVPRVRIRTANKLNLTAKDAKNAKFSSSNKASPAICILAVQNQIHSVLEIFREG
jgi:hypothetical protein